MRLLQALATLALAASAMGPAHAQEFPSKPVRIVVPFPAGGSFDSMSRLLAQRMQLGQSVIVENRPGGGTVIGTEYVARQPADGHTILCIGPSFTMHSALRSKLPFDTDRDFRALAQAMGLNMVVAVNASLPVKTMKEYIALARARPGEMSYGTSGPGTSHNLLGEALKLAAKVNITHTPYQGEAPAVTAAVGGHITGVLVNLFSTAPYIKAGRLRGLAVTSSDRDALVPDIPTAREAGFPDIEAINWSGFVVPAGTTSAAVARLNSEIVRVLNMPDVRENMRGQGMIATPSSPEQFAALLKSDGARYAKIARAANVRLD
ncbi:MAG TPA: tripartite tricarboxylate transporter substrate binding protein [Burkholderiales bacterium]|nr:tripartite tricarboxylate transporter substrate binding protein [Burkholderiales bacterium]